MRLIFTISTLTVTLLGSHALAQQQQARLSPITQRPANLRQRVFGVPHSAKVKDAAAVAKRMGWKGHVMIDNLIKSLLRNMFDHFKVGMIAVAALHKGFFKLLARLAVGDVTNVFQISRVVNCRP